MWWSPWSILVELLDYFRFTMLVEFAFCYESIALIFLILIVLLVLLILWKKLFWKNEFWAIQIVWHWPTRTLRVIFACITILSFSNILNINVIIHVQRVARLIKSLIFSIWWDWLGSSILQAFEITKLHKYSWLWILMWRCIFSNLRCSWCMI